jgi:hypothetical protein
MTCHRTRASRRMAAFLAAGVFMTSALAAEPVAAQPNNGAGAKASCTWAGSTYSHGGVHDHRWKGSDGKTYTTRYTCDNGEWKAGTTWTSAKRKLTPIKHLTPLRATAAR